MINPDLVLTRINVDENSHVTVRSYAIPAQELPLPLISENINHKYIIGDVSEDQDGNPLNFINPQRLRIAGTGGRRATFDTISVTNTYTRIRNIYNS